MSKKLIRLGLASRVARQFAVAQILDFEAAAEAFNEEAMTAEERRAAFSELRLIAERIAAGADDFPV
ncbi:hypothetical protein [Pseudomonas sp. TTU2014-080ASC]|uniref:hypothetical protein n=1 Tax=Pseudomonas sp. TTU2014-080ASC TaxID=1729724 RepID=UPI00071879EB|nr:hypothetical protein [Pseudomonas sp. TTU2014-080ASC]KRW62323.1 hypothetical protein AO726_02560 [Pseudomonas sp. TTU2014-080ASC]